MNDARIVDLKTFVPAKDFELSRSFYRDLGFTEKWHNKEVAEFEAGAFRFLLQNYFVKDWAENFMMQLMVEDADVWWRNIMTANLREKYKPHTLKPPALQPWGLRVLYISDPAGVLWHIADAKRI